MSWIPRAHLVPLLIAISASGAAAQEAAPAAPEAAPGAPAGEAAAPPAEPAPAEAPPESPPAAEPPPPSFPGGDEPSEPPPPPQYAQLGGQPEPEIKEGDWDPWAHAPIGKHRHDGFFLRLAIGFGGGSVRGEGGRVYDEITYSGTGLGLDIGIGGAIIDNLILHGEIFDLTIFEPDVEETPDGDSVDTASDLGIEDLEMAGLGMGVTYYFMPINLYVGGSVGFGQVIYEDDQGDLQDSDVGLALTLMVGKEWWVGLDWGIGVAALLAHVSTDDYIDGDIKATALTIMFSATHN